MRPRKKDRHLPPCVFLKHGAYWYVKRGKWTRLAADLPAALVEYARLHRQKTGGMVELIENALPSILKGKAESTRKTYTRTARYLQEVFLEYAPDQVTQRDVVAIRKRLVDQPSVCNRTINVLRMVFDYALEEEILDSNPCVGVKSLKPNRRNRYMETREFDEIKKHADPLLRIVMDLCYLTGQRIGDVLKIKQSDLSDKGVFIDQQKGQGTVRIFIAWNTDLRATVDAALALHGGLQSDYLLNGGRWGKPPVYGTIWAHFNEARNAAKVEGVTIHDIRAKSGTDTDEQGMDPQKLLGHTNPEMTRHYLRKRRIAIVQGPSFRQSKTDPEKPQ